MTTTITRPPVVRQGTVRVGGGTHTAEECRSFWRHGMSAPVTITSITRNGPVSGYYWLSVLRDQDGRAEMYVLIRDQADGTAEIYHLPAALDECTCADSTFRPNVVCKHRRAVAAIVARFEELQ